MKVEFKMTGVDHVLSMLKQLPPAVVGKGGGPVLAALRKGARVLLAQERINLAKSTAGSETTGLLMKSLAVSRGKAPSGSKGERVVVRVRRKTYPGTGKKSGKKAVTTLTSANLLEYGSSKQQAEPWIRPAFATRREEAARAIETTLVKRVTALAKKFLR